MCFLLIIYTNDLRKKRDKIKNLTILETKAYFAFLEEPFHHYLIVQFTMRTSVALIISITL